MFRKQEVQHNTPEQVREYLQQALDTVTALHLPADLQEAAFKKAVELHSSKTVTLEQVGVGGILGANAGH